MVIGNKIIVIVWLSLVSTTGYAQLFAGPERQALNSMERRKWDKAYSNLEKALRKDSLNASARYVFALYFFSVQNPGFQIDSAYQYALDARSDFDQADVREQERLKRFPLDTAILTRLRKRIDSAALEQATRVNTEEAYLKFLSIHTFAAGRARAVELRNEVSYFNAMKENTYLAFDAFLKKYPDAIHAPDARKKYERLLYETKTVDKKLTSFQSFLTEFPGSPYRKDTEQQILELMTMGGSSEDFSTFINTYPESFFATKARNFLYHIALETGKRSPLAWTDSLQQVYATEKGYLVPFFRDGKYGFLDEAGKELIAPVAGELPDAYRCGNVADDILVFSDRVIAKNGAVIFQGIGVESVDDLGFGFLKIETGQCQKLVHKSGVLIIDCAEEVRLLNGRMIAAKNNGRWSLYNLSGRKLPVGEWDGILSIGDVIAFERKGRISLVRINDFKTGMPTITPQYDEVKAWPNNRIWTRTGDRQGILDQSLTVLIKPERYVLTPVSTVCLAQSHTGYSFFNTSGNQSVQFKKIITSDAWTAVKNQDWRLYNPSAAGYQSPSYDSISFAGPFAVCSGGDSLRIYFSPENFSDFVAGTTIEFIPGKDSTSFLVAGEEDKRIVFDHTGQRLFSITCDKIQDAGGGYFIIRKKDKSKKDRSGLVSSSGKMVLPPEFDAIGNTTNGVVSLLRDKKFGLLDVKNQRQIKPEYTKNVTTYTSRYLAAYDGKFFGFITWDNKPWSGFDFEEIRYWSDSVAWVRKNYQWMLYDIEARKVVEDQIKDYTMIVDGADEKIAIIRQDGHYGVISSKHDEIIPPTFSSIVNVGSSEQPMYFTAKHIEEASIYVVIYYDSKGVFLRRQVYEEDDFENISCRKKP